MNIGKRDKGIDPKDERDAEIAANLAMPEADVRLEACRLARAHYGRSINLRSGSEPVVSTTGWIDGRGRKVHKL